MDKQELISRGTARWTSWQVRTLWITISKQRDTQGLAEMDLVPPGTSQVRLDRLIWNPSWGCLATEARGDHLDERQGRLSPRPVETSGNKGWYRQNQLSFFLCDSSVFWFSSNFLSVKQTYSPLSKAILVNHRRNMDVLCHIGTVYLSFHLCNLSTSIFTFYTLSLCSWLSLYTNIVL